MEPLESHAKHHDSHDVPALHGLVHGHHADAHERSAHESVHLNPITHHVEGKEVNIHGLHMTDEDHTPRHHWTQAHKYGSHHARGTPDHHTTDSVPHIDRKELHREKLHLHGDSHHDVEALHEVAHTQIAAEHHVIRAAEHHEPVSAHLAEPRHVTHPEQDHKYDDHHDVEQVKSQEHDVHKAILHSVRHQDKGKPIMTHQEKLHKDAHTAVHDPHATVHHIAAHDTRLHVKPRHDYHHEEPKVEHHDDHHTDVQYHSEHLTHPELDHKYDDQRDVEPVHFHEHAVLKVSDHPDTRSYEHTTAEELQREHVFAQSHNDHYYHRHYSSEHGDIERHHEAI